MSRVIFVILCFALFNATSFAEETDEAPPSPAPSEANAIIWIDGKLPGTPQTEGNWLWDENMKQQEAVSHTDAGRDTLPKPSPYTQGLGKHSFKTDATIEVTKDSKIIQYAYLDPKDTPKGIMMKLILKGPQEISVYWEAEEEVFADMNEYITAWYIGFLPKSGEWVRLELDLKEMDITKEELEGLAFIAKGGRLWWGKTIIERGEYAKKETQGQAEMAQQKGE